MQNRQSSLRRLAEAGLIAAMYAALSLCCPSHRSALCSADWLRR